MDSGSSVISLSSSASKGSRHSSSESSLTSVITVSSETQRVPVSWESGKVCRQKGQVLDLEQTPNHSEKVKNWMNSCRFEPKDPDTSKNEDESNKSTCIRYDFNKSPRSSVVVPQSCYTFTAPLSSYMEEAKKSTKLKSAESNRANGSSSHKNHSNCDTPSSPDSQKKELCSYLQLMKPDDKQNNFFIEYRRSARVKTHSNEVKETNCDEKDTNYATDHPTMKSSDELSLNVSKTHFNWKREHDLDTANKFLPLPPKRIYTEVTDFENSVRVMIEQELNLEKVKNVCLKEIEKRRKFNFGFKFQQKIKNARLNLRSKGRLRNISLDKLILRKGQLRKKTRKKIVDKFKEKQTRESTKVEEKQVVKGPAKNDSPRCEIISVHTNSDDENVDLKNFVDDMLELDKMSEEHRKSVIESRILASSSITNLISKRATREADVQRAYKIFSDLSIEKKNSEEKENAQDCDRQTDPKEGVKVDENVESIYNDTNLVSELIVSEHDYATCNSSSRDEDEEEEVCQDDDESLDSLSPVPIPNLQVLPVKEVQVKSLRRSLAVNNRRKLFLNNYGLHNFSGSNNNRKSNHSISISKKNGTVLRTFYQEYNLIVTQQNFISFWTQSALGNVLGAQNMWIPKGEIQRINLNSTYIQKDARDMVITTETSVAYVELWTKEHKSELREVPVADVFAVVYFWRLRQTGLDKKALQLENIKGFTDDVQYCVLKCYPRIIVSWHSVQGTEKKTKIHSYHLAADFQTVANISQIQPVEHYVSSLHNIEDCDSLVMGCGENKITLWNVEYGYIVATIEMSTIKSPLSTLWVKCDRGFLFTIQECVDQELRLIAINGMDHSWKKLQNYNPLPGFHRLKGVCIDNGILVAYYAQGILCWNAQTGELIVEEVANECDSCIPSGKHVIMIVNENIIVRHSLSHLITDL